MLKHKAPIILYYFNVLELSGSLSPIVETSQAWPQCSHYQRNHIFSKPLLNSGNEGCQPTVRGDPVPAARWGHHISAEPVWPLCVPTLINWVKNSAERLMSGTFPFPTWLREAAVQPKGNARQRWGAVLPWKPAQNPDVFEPPFKH